MLEPMFTLPLYRRDDTFIPVFFSRRSADFCGDSVTRQLCLWVTQGDMLLSCVSTWEAYTDDLRSWFLGRKLASLEVLSLRPKSAAIRE